jgi:hypothetical protein
LASLAPQPFRAVTFDLGTILNRFFDDFITSRWHPEPAATR